MKRVWGHVLAGVTLLAGAAAGFPACAHNDSSIFIRSVLAPQFATNGAACFWGPDPAQAFIWSGVLDVALRGEYDAVFLVGNQLVPQVNPSQLMTETSLVTIQGAIVRVTDSSGHEITRFTRLTSASIAPSSGNTPGFAPIRVTIVSPQAIQQSADIQANIANAPIGASGLARLVTYTRFFGQTLGGKSVESDEFEYPVDVCNGCLIGFTTQFFLSGKALPTPNCLGDAPGGASQPQVPCDIGQDLAISCKLCSGVAACAGAYQQAPPGGGVDAGGD